MRKGQERAPQRRTSKITLEPDTPANARELSRLQNRNQLIQSAADAIYKYGIRGTTAARIQELSGLSQGMVNLHFGSKEKLLLAVAEDLSVRYAGQWKAIAFNPELAPADKLISIIKADFDPLVLNARDVSIWFSFRAEALSNPHIFPFIDSRDKGFRAVILELLEQIKVEGEYDDVDAKLATDALVALLEGLWTDYHLHSKIFEPSEALKICLFVLQSVFPRHFST
ncbi:TetR family transcriptional regulator [Ruegeria conchae]|uniref:TetR family transcriptional regulator n=1 Tax=Ruegeria conchae TaxID=981384 RepID=A0A497ZHC0_9RHOB|nr:TetR/AcrR family transcriptional regulator [Ruegeria conchae]RLK08021.1 TetR family transcriptional regulator [Ruegeria conchae]